MDQNLHHYIKTDVQMCRSPTATSKAHLSHSYDTTVVRVSVHGTGGLTSCIYPVNGSSWFRIKTVLRSGAGLISHWKTIRCLSCCHPVVLQSPSCYSPVPGHRGNCEWQRHVTSLDKGAEAVFSEHRKQAHLVHLYSMVWGHILYVVVHITHVTICYASKHVHVKVPKKAFAF